MLDTIKNAVYNPTCKTEQRGGENMFSIKELREQFNLTQEELARRSQVSRTTIAKLESGEEVVTTTKTLNKIAQALHPHSRDIFLP